MKVYLLNSVENIVAKGENVFLPQCCQMSSAAEELEKVCKWEKVNNIFFKYTIKQRYEVENVAFACSQSMLQSKQCFKKLFPNCFQPSIIMLSLLSYSALLYFAEMFSKSSGAECCI